MKRVFFSAHGVLIVGLVLLAILVDESELDLWLANLFYNWEGQSWAMRNAFLIETILHKGVRQLLVFMVLMLLILAVASRWIDRFQHWQRHQWFLIACFVSVPLLVALGKSVTHMDCPWDIVLFGGEKPYLHLLQPHPGTWAYGSCFPGGHSSGGFSLIAVYFLLSIEKPQWRYQALAIALCVGFVSGFTQQIRGGHFFSHDLWSLAIAWLIGLTYQYLFFKNRLYPLRLISEQRDRRGLP